MIMKKTYSNPQTRIVLLATKTFIALSNPQGFKGALNDNGTDAGNLLSRRHNDLWDDEEEYDEEE